MNNVIETMLSKYNPKNNADRENAIKEIIQEIALSGLSKGGFFEKAAFYGGTCLRIFHGLNRFSEDLDFALLHADPSFRLDDYLPFLKNEFSSYGIDLDVEKKTKGEGAEIQSAFLKGNTLMLMMSFFPKNEEAQKVVSNQKIRIKLEIDIDNPEGGRSRFEYRLFPTPCEIRVFDEATLFAGKIHAILCRDYKHHIKGRDYYDYLFYIGKGTKINLAYLENKLHHSNSLIKANEKLTIEKTKELLKDRFLTVDYESAKVDVLNFIDDKSSVEFWKKELFLSTLEGLEGI